jgi:hypothetical protein
MFKLYCLSDTVAIIFYQSVERGKSRGTVLLLFSPKDRGNTVVDDA